MVKHQHIITLYLNKVTVNVLFLIPNKSLVLMCETQVSLSWKLNVSICSTLTLDYTRTCDGETYLVRRQTSWRTSSLMAAVPRLRLYSNSSRMRPWSTRICRRAGLVANARSSVIQ